MDGRNREQIEADEIAFFAHFFQEGAYNPTGWRLRLRRELRCLLHQSGLRRLGRVLCIGCGDGQFEVMLSRHAESITALDLSPEAIAVARR